MRLNNRVMRTVKEKKHIPLLHRSLSTLPSLLLLLLLPLLLPLFPPPLPVPHCKCTFCPRAQLIHLSYAHMLHRTHQISIHWRIALIFDFPFVTLASYISLSTSLEFDHQRRRTRELIRNIYIAEELKIVLVSDVYIECTLYSVT